jgi:hypothetical protein
MEAIDLNTLAPPLYSIRASLCGEEERRVVHYPVSQSEPDRYNWPGCPRRSVDESCGHFDDWCVFGLGALASRAEHMRNENIRAEAVAWRPVWIKELLQYG